MGSRGGPARRRRRLARLGAACAVGATAALVSYTAQGAPLGQVAGQGSVAPSPPPVGVAPTGIGNVSGLDPALRHAFDVARNAAAVQGVELHITSGWRSHREQA